MPDGVILNIIANGQNYKSIMGPVHLHAYFGNTIMYTTNPTASYQGNSIIGANELIFPDVFFIRLLSFDGE